MRWSLSFLMLFALCSCSWICPKQEPVYKGLKPGEIVIMKKTLDDANAEVVRQKILLLNCLDAKK